MKPRIIIDCDPGHDDAIAILLALKHADLLGISTVSGNAPLQHTTRNALSILELAGSHVPVHAGAAEPLSGEPLHAGHVHGSTGLGGIDLDPPRSSVASEDATAWLLDMSRQEPSLWIVAVGPLTNLALAIREDPGFVTRLAGISIMGGSATIGNATPVAEFNILADPEAAAAVFESGATLKMCGLNLTRQLMTDDGIVDSLKNQGVVPDLVARLYAFMHDRLDELTGERRAALHDPCALLALTHPELFVFQPRHVAVEANGTYTRGMTVVDQRPSLNKEPPNAEVGYQLDSGATMKIVTETLLSYGRE